MTTTTTTTRPAPVRRAASLPVPALVDPANSPQLSVPAAPLRQGRTNHWTSSSTTAAVIDQRESCHHNDIDCGIPLQIFFDQIPTREYDESCSNDDNDDDTVKSSEDNIISAGLCHQDQSESDNDANDLMSISDCGSLSHGVEHLHNLIEEVLREVQPTSFGATLRATSLARSECSARSHSIFSIVSKVNFFEDESCSFACSRTIPYANTLQRRASDNCHRMQRAAVWERPGSLLHAGWIYPTERVEL